MKRHGRLWPQIIDFSNLLHASRNARRGKRYRDNVLAFEAQLETELLRLQTELQNKTWQPGGYRTFYIHEPKKRLISAAPYSDDANISCKNNPVFTFWSADPMERCTSA